MNISKNFHDVKDLLNVLTNLKIPYIIKARHELETRTLFMDGKTLNWEKVLNR